MQSQLKILFVDDHVGLRDGMTQMLKNKNSSFDFVCASDYESALETLKENRGIKIVILDLNLDGRSGLELIPELKKLSPDIAILIYTMFNDVIHVENSLLNGVQGYITKDATIDELASAITTVANGNSYFNKAATELMQSLLVKHGREHDITNDLSYLFDSYKSLSKKSVKFLFFFRRTCTLQTLLKSSANQKKQSLTSEPKFIQNLI